METERNFKICAAETLLLVKVLFEEVRFKASFDGREERAVTEREMKRIPKLCCGEAEGKVGIRKGLSSEDERRNLEET